MKFSWTSLQIAMIIAFVFFLQTVQPWITNDFLLNSAQATQRPWTFVTSIFLHGSLEHLAYNLLSLVIFGLVVENIVGKKKFLIIFFASGIFANFLAVFFYDASLGASGAVFGLIGFLAAIRPKLMVPAFGIPLPVIAAAFLWVLISFAGIFSPDETAYAAHLGGLVFGFALGFFLRKNYSENRVKEKLLSENEINEWEEQYMKNS